ATYGLRNRAGKSRRGRNASSAASNAPIASFNAILAAASGHDSLASGVPVSIPRSAPKPVGASRGGAGKGVPDDVEFCGVFWVTAGEVAGSLGLLRSRYATIAIIATPPSNAPITKRRLLPSEKNRAFHPVSPSEAARRTARSAANCGSRLFSVLFVLVAMSSRFE